MSTQLNSLTRIAYLVSQYPATNHTFILREIRGLRALGLDVGVISIRPPDRPLAAMTPDEQDEAARVLCVRTAGMIGFLASHGRAIVREPLRYLKTLGYVTRLGGWDFRRLLYHLAYFAQAVVAANWMNDNGFEHVHSHFSSTVALLAAHAFPITWSATMHGPDEFRDPKAFHLDEKCHSSRFLITISEHGRAQLTRSSIPGDWAKFKVCRLGVDPSAFSPAAFRDHPGCFEILSVGRLAPVKAQQILLEAVDLLVKEGRAVRLRIVGEGPARPLLETQIARRQLDGRAILEGALNQDRLLPLYASADLFALSSLAEGVPVVLMEAMAREIACVATAVNGVPELIRDGESGLLVPPSDAPALAAAIARLMDDPLLRRKLAQNGRSRVCADYDLNANIKQLAEIFRSAGISSGDTSTAESTNT